MYQGPYKSLILTYFQIIVGGKIKSPDPKITCRPKSGKNALLQVTQLQLNNILHFHKYGEYGQVGLLETTVAGEEKMATGCWSQYHK